MSQPPGPQNPGNWGPAPSGPPGQHGQPVQPGPWQQQGHQQYGPGPQQWNQHPVPPKRPSRAPKILLMIGGGLILLGVILAALLGRGIMSSIPDEDSITRIGSGATVTVTEHTLLYRPEGQAINCRIFGPTDDEPNLEYNGPRMSFTHAGQMYESFGQLGGGDGPWGDYEVTCDNGDAIAAPPLDVGALGGGVAGLVGGALLGGLGIILLIAGLIMHVINRNKRY